jgi:hypothetical protein
MKCLSLALIQLYYAIGPLHSTLAKKDQPYRMTFVTLRADPPVVIDRRQGYETSPTSSKNYLKSDIQPKRMC